MNLPELTTWIDGAAEPSELADDTWLHDPNTGAQLAPSRSSSTAQVDRAIAAAHAAHVDGEWLRLGVAGRAPFLLALADRLDELAAEIAELDALNSGVPISVTRLFAGSNGDTIRSAVARAVALGDHTVLAAEQGGVQLHRVPWGATALIMPWNAPSAMAVKKLAYALVSGAPAVMKPSPASPWSALLIAAATAELGFPAGVVNLVLGGAAVGNQLVSDPRIRAISMTGSTPTGRAIAAAAGPNLTRLRLELGSNNAAIVLQDADLSAAAASIVSGAMKLSGQWCEAPRRVIAPRELVDPLVEALVTAMSALRIGSSLDEQTELGPVAFEGRKLELEHQREALRAAGGVVIEVGAAPADGWFFAPTLVVGDTIDLDLEIFGPMLTVQPADSVTHAIDLANAGHVGLAGYVFGQDESTARAVGIQLDAGEIKINGTSVLDLCADSAQSFFGSSGIGGHGDADVLDFFSGKRIIGTDKPGLPL
ncbi:aldehyde dehydrogenase family protein [Leifsonia kafniensis]|uniref:Aldehyde dehydrogenase family protein n=1 Tax=Leifsonia kafniensis TaxID=475957 RepID=A0ABP7KH11_9MICO